MSVARFKVTARLDMASREQRGTVEIDRAVGGLFTVRAHRKKRRYALSLNDVAAMVVRSIIAAEVRTKRAAKRGRHA